MQWITPKNIVNRKVNSVIFCVIIGIEPGCSILMLYFDPLASCFVRIRPSACGLGPDSHKALAIGSKHNITLNNRAQSLNYNTPTTRFGPATKFRPWDLSFDRFWPMGIRHTITPPSSHWLIDWIGSSKHPLQSIYLSVCRHYFYTPPPPRNKTLISTAF